MPTTRSLFHLLFLLPLFAHAQDPPWPQVVDLASYGPVLFENAQDSVDFLRFRNGLQPADLTLPTDTATYQYRLAWRENQRGGFTVVSRGDGSVLRSAERVAFDPYALMPLPCRTADGLRVLVLVVDEPCGLICRSVRYYVEQ